MKPTCFVLLVICIAVTGCSDGAKAKAEIEAAKVAQAKAEAELAKAKAELAKAQPGAAVPAVGLPPDPSKPLLTQEVGERFLGSAVGRMTEAEAIKLLPAAYKLGPAPKTLADWRITCTETTEVEVEFTDGGVLSSFSAKFHPSVTSKNLTLERFRLLKAGQPKAEVEKLFGTSNRRGGDTFDDDRRKVTRWRWVAGRELFILITNGRVSGSGFMEYVEE